MKFDLIKGKSDYEIKVKDNYFILYKKNSVVGFWKTLAEANEIKNQLEEIDKLNLGDFNEQ